MLTIFLRAVILYLIMVLYGGIFRKNSGKPVERWDKTVYNAG